MALHPLLRDLHVYSNSPYRYLKDCTTSKHTLTPIMDIRGMGGSINHHSVSASKSESYYTVFQLQCREIPFYGFTHSMIYKLQLLECISQQSSNIHEKDMNSILLMEKSRLKSMQLKHYGWSGTCSQTYFSKSNAPSVPEPCPSLGKNSQDMVHPIGPEIRSSV